jgi:hypothetical protein
MLRGMNRVCRVGAAVSVAAGLLVLVAGCGADGAGADGKPTPSVSASVSPSGPDVREAFVAYRTAAAPGCETAPECQELMTNQLGAALELRAAMQAKDPALYAEPIRLVNVAEQRADHYGRDNLAARGNFYAVSKPLQEMQAWFGQNPGL